MRTLLCLAALVIGCGDGGAGGPDGAISCEGVTQCAAEGARCDGDTVVTCAHDADGCLVETRTSCAATGRICDAISGGCVDRCSAIPAEQRCDVEGRSCSSDVLTVCAPNATGCLVPTTTDCAASAGGRCDATSAMAMCVGLPDPCHGVPVEDRCDAEGTSCAGDTLHACAPNTFGCLVEAETDCAAGGEGCGTDHHGVSFCGRPCDFLETCSAAAACDGNAALTCAPNADGCLVETGRTQCAASACVGGQCRGDCAPATPPILDCASGTVVGDTAGGTTVFEAYRECVSGGHYPGPERVFLFAHAGDPVEVRIDSVRTSGSADFDLFVLDASSECTDDSACIDVSTEGVANETVRFVAGRETVRYVAYDAFESTATSRFTLTVSCAPVICGDGVVRLGEGCDDGNTTSGDGCSASCAVEEGYLCPGSPSACALACGNGAIDRGESCDDGNRAADDGCSAACAVEDGYLCAGAPSVCALACGNGRIDAARGESCDDGNRAAGDGCSATCGQEPGWACRGMPSMCALQGSNGTCADALPATDGLVDDVRSGGPRPTGVYCGAYSGSALYYSLTVPARTQTHVAIEPSSGWNAVVNVIAACGDIPSVGCQTLSDLTGSGGRERVTVTNDSDAPLDRIIAVSAAYAGTGGELTMTVESEPVPFTAIPAACEAVPATPDSVQVYFSAGATWQISASAALPFPLSFLGDPAGFYSVSTSGIVTFSATMGSSSPLAMMSENWPIPTPRPPNFLLAAFWDELIVGTGGSVRSWIVGAEPDRRWVIDWNNMGFRGVSTAAPIRFQAHVLESGVIELHYCNIPAAPLVVRGSGATIGLEDRLGSSGRLVSFNTRDAVATGSAFRFAP